MLDFTLLLTVGLVILVAYVFLGTTTADLFTITYLDDANTAVGTDTLEVSTFVYSQLLSPTTDFPLVLQATTPLTTPITAYQVSVSIPNPYPGTATLQRLRLTHNDQDLDTQTPNTPIAAKNQYTYNSAKIPLPPERGLPQTLTLHLEWNYANATKEISLTYAYIILDICTTHQDCPAQTPQCDTANYAQYPPSTTGTKYCTRACNSHTDCPPTQLCRIGHCGP